MTTAGQSDEAVDQDRIFFIHIPKTAGVSFKAVLRDAFGKESICPIAYEADFFRRPSENLHHYRVFSGHHSYYLARILPGPLKILTFLRDPIRRAISAYTHVMRDRRHFAHAIAVNQAPTLKTFCAHPWLGQ